ncbi:MAG: hypothetical protein JJU34_18430 [Lunatimonas sp.]|uniref:hypothetical protein n=1 Tax=Lunatimonas sp. TaxID=2060141 RepID=UPI00263B74AC|nr:hypothetical protein [Lunatimonas sp.]MCC5939263.1 hypothetical protein [Lunatimonas sp.]
MRYSDPMGLMGDDAGMWGTGNTYASNYSQNPFDLMPKAGGFTGPGSGHHWSDRIGNSDWSMWGGSQMYKDGLASGAIEYGGKFYNIDGDGNRGDPYEERNGRLGYWVDYTTTTVSGNYLGGSLTLSAKPSQWVNVESNSGRDQTAVNLPSLNHNYVIDGPQFVGGDIPFIPGPGNVKGGYTLYRAIAKDGKTYWGITKDIVRRGKQHGERFAMGLDEVYTNLSKGAARGLEQLKIDQHGLKNLDNIINSISTRKPKLAEYYREAIKYLKELQ